MTKGGDSPRQWISNIQRLKSMMKSKIRKYPQYSETADTEYADNHWGNRIT